MVKPGKSSVLVTVVALLAGGGVWLLRVSQAGTSPESPQTTHTVEAKTTAPNKSDPPKNSARRPTGQTTNTAQQQKTPAVEEKPDAPAPKRTAVGTRGGEKPAPAESTAKNDAQSGGPTGGGFRPQVPEGAELPDPIPSSVDGLKPVVLKSGVKYWDIRVGEGVVPQEGAMIITSFRAWLMDGDDVGELVDSSSHQQYNPPFYKRNLAPGLQDALWSMREGGIRQVYLPADQGWGAKGKPPAIPPNSEMLFQVQLMEVRNPPAQTAVSGLEPHSTKSGAKYWDLKIGDGPVVLPRANVKVRFTGWLKDGTMFDTTEMMRRPKSVSLARSGIIAGWREAIPGMRVGGKRRLELPPELAYGKARAGPIPANATLIFEVEVVGMSEPPPLPMPTPVTGITPVKTETGLTYWDIKEGSGSEPQEKSTVTIQYSIWLSDGTIAQTTKDTGRPIAAPLRQFNPGMREGISSMKVGGIRQMRVPPDLAYGEEGILPEIPPNATLTIEVELVGLK